MKPAEFLEIKERFEKDQARWESLNVGDIIYDEQSRWGDMDYHKMEIDSIDVEERVLEAHDVSGDHKGTLTFFLTEKEFNNRKY